MYHISNDVRAQKSASLIVKAVHQCAKTKKLEDISIADLQRESSISRSTFYRLFDNIVDVLVYQCDCVFQNLFEIVATAQNTNPHDTFITLIQAFMDEYEFIELLSKNNHMEILCDYHRKNMPHIKSIFKIDSIENQWTVDYVCNILSILLPTVLSVWIQHGKQESAEDIYLNIKNSFKILGAMDDIT